MNIKAYYHGTIDVFSKRIMHEIDLEAGRFFTDFGQGFYVTDNRRQAEIWAMGKWKDNIYLDERVIPSVVVIDIDLDMLSLGQGLIFEEPNCEWADFVLQCRSAGLKNRRFHCLDFAEGPLGDGKMAPLITKVTRGDLSKEEFYKAIAPVSDSYHQLSLHTPLAVGCIVAKEVYNIERLTI